MVFTLFMYEVCKKQTVYKIKTQNMSSTFTASAEQVAICNAIRNSPAETILRISAVAGSGKTTTNLYVASQFKDSKILLLTYNKFLAEETKGKICKLGLTNIEVRTFHGFAGEIFKKTVHNDDILIELLRKTVADDEYDDCIDEPIRDYSSIVEDEPSKPDYDIVVFDEAQDLTLPLFKLCEHIYKIFVKPFSTVRLIIFGDPRQCIYGYNGADYRYMKFIGPLFGCPVIDLTLSVSYRVSDQVATFINETCYGGQHVIDGAHEGPLPEFIVRSKYDTCYYVANKIIELVNIHGISPEEIFIITPSAKIKKNVKNNSVDVHHSLLTITNKLTDNGIMSFIDSDGYTVDHDCLSKKVVISSIHKSKGRERSYVFLIGFDHTYFKYYARDYKKNPRNYVDGTLIMPNEMYVALTRSSHKLWIMAQSYSCGKFVVPIEFIDNTLIQTYANCRDYDTKSYFQSKSSWKQPGLSNDVTNISVTDLIGAMEALRKNRLKTMLKITELRKSNTAIKLVTKIKERHNKYGVYYEDVADINGIASVLCALRDDLSSQELDDYCFAEYGHEIDLSSVQKVLQEARKIQSEYIGHRARANQLINDSWIPEKTLQRMSARIRNVMPIGICEKAVNHDFGNNLIAGKIDNIYGNTIYEIKTKSGVSIDDFIQVAVYRIILENIKYDSQVSVDNLVQRRADHFAGPLDIGSVVTDGEHYGSIVSITKKDDTVIKAKIISFDDGHARNIKMPKLYEPYYLTVPDGNENINILYNCRDDSMYSVEITDLKRFQEIVFDTRPMYDDDEFILMANKQL